MTGYSTCARRGLRRAILAVCAATMATIVGNPAISASAAPISLAEQWSYADIADLFVEAPIVAKLRIAEVVPVPPESGASRRPGTVRYYLVGDVLGLIRGTGGLAPRVAFVADVPLDGRGKPPKLKKMQVLVAALPVPGKPAELRLAARDGMVVWSASIDARIRKVIADGLATGAPPHVTGIASAFHSAGTLPGEGESQIFLTTRETRPVSISVLRRPGQAPRWSVALDEIVDESAAIPARDTLLWYRLACFLPRDLPVAAVGELAEADATAAQADYAFVIEALGPCARTRG